MAPLSDTWPPFTPATGRATASSEKNAAMSPLGEIEQIDYTLIVARDVAAMCRER